LTTLRRADEIQGVNALLLRQCAAEGVRFFGGADAWVRYVVSKYPYAYPD
jgi:hypothetical protein